MSELVVNGASLKCPLGLPGAAALAVLPTPMVSSGEQPVATVMDYKPLVNVPSFGMCTTLDNPQVKAATAAAQGTLTPQPCLPVITQPWSPGSSTVTVGNNAALTSDSTCKCEWKGEISITMAGQKGATTG